MQCVEDVLGFESEGGGGGSEGGGSEVGFLEFKIYDALKGTSFKCLFCAILCVLISQTSAASCSPSAKNLFHNYGGLNKIYRI